MAGITQPTGQDFRPKSDSFSKLKTPKSPISLSFTIVEEKHNLKVRRPTPTTEVHKDNGIRLCEFGHPHHNYKDTQKVVLVVGATGAGKTTLINTMTNCMLGVKWESDFRYKLVVEEGAGDQSKSQTQEITAYTFHPSCNPSLEYSITIIDTPGFGDTRGKSMDEKITDKVRSLFAITGEYAIDYIHGIIFVVKSSSSRLTEAQKYIFNSVLELFGKDVEKNIFIAATFCDNKKDVKALTALRASSVPYEAVLHFNNSGLYYTPDPVSSDDSDDDDDELAKMKINWRMGEKTFKNFIKELASAKAVSATQTKHVLNERRELELIMQKLPDHIKKLIAKIDEIEKDKGALKELTSEAKKNKDYTYTVTVTKTRKVKVTDGRKVTTCKICEHTCDSRCICSSNLKYFCQAISIKGKCKYCPNHCSYKDHEDDGYIYEQYQEEEQRTKEDIKKKYCAVISDEFKRSMQIKQMEEELRSLNHQAIQSIRKAFHCVEKLDEIALRPKTTSVSAHIQKLIDQETKQREVGWERRIKYFGSLPQNRDAMTELEKQDDSWFKKIMHTMGEQTETFFDEIDRKVRSYVPSLPTHI